MGFSRLPIEVNAHIAACLDYDTELCNFSLICRETHDAVTCDGSPVWREYFIKHFDLVPHVSNNTLRRAYQIRRKVLRNGAKFRLGHTKVERDCLHVLKNLMLESFSNGNVERDEKGFVTSRNMLAIKHFAYSFNCVQEFIIPSDSAQRKKRSTTLMLMTHVMLSHLQFDLNIETRVFGFPDSQRAMYATVQEMPIFTGPKKDEVNIHWVANAINFFKYHFTQPKAQTLWHYYSDLIADERVQGWRKPLQGGTYCLGKNWKGIYSYQEREDVEKIRAGTDETPEDIFNNTEDGNVPFQTLRLAFSNPNSKKVWPPLFERHLQSVSGSYAKSASSPVAPQPVSKSRTRAQLRAGPAADSSLRAHPLTEDQSKRASLPFHFHGSGMDVDKFFASGWLNPLPTQQGFPGMQRMTMMKYFMNDDEDPDDLVNEDDDPFGMKGLTALNQFDINETSLWAYEGVVLPGGEIIVGRWWSPDSSDDQNKEEMYSGPFMFWCVDDEAIETR